jgi:exonuclease SbcD
MKFLHISDLHIGKSVHGFSMLEEQKHVFEQIIRYIKSEQVNAVVIAGDIYDSAIPRSEAIRVFDDFLTELAHTNVAVLLISGNHDSPERISYANRLLSDRQLFLCGSFSGSLQKVTLTDGYGELNFWLLPFIKPLSVSGFFGEQKIETHADALEAVIRCADIDYSARNVLVSHQFFTKSGVVPIRCDSELTPVGGLDAISTGLIAQFDYVALGHLHREQKVGVEHICYPGSPLKYSLSEIGQTKSVLLVELNQKSNVTTKKLVLVPMHDVCEIKGKLADLMSPTFVSQINKDDYLYVVLTDEEEILDPMEKLRSIYPHVMTFRFENSRTNHDYSVYQNLSQPNQLSPCELFSEFFLAVCGCTMNPEQSKLVKELLTKESVP